MEPVEKDFQKALVGSLLRCVPAGVEAVLWAWCATETGPDERFLISSNVVFCIIVALNP